MLAVVAAVAPVEIEGEKSLLVAVVALLLVNVGHMTFPKTKGVLQVQRVNPAVTEDIIHQVLAADCTLVVVAVAAARRLVVNTRD